MITKYQPDTTALDPMTKNGIIDEPNVYAILLQNAGNNTVSLYHGKWTLCPGGVLSLGNDWLQPSAEDVKIPVEFDNSNLDANTTPNNRLEIIVRRVYEKKC
jgi:hypothetical protein